MITGHPYLNPANPGLTVTKVYDTVQLRDGSIGREWLWYLVGGSRREGRFLGLCSEMTAKQADELARKVVQS